VLYDYMVGSPDTASATTLVSAGSIVIHT